ncbi:MAG: FMN-binding domain-containing protein [Bacteroidetes bacterium GWF2_40_14]|nr:MAG: FMN-binding domain-containing protein [Bacteroidetes bacterium GWF2_40_14]
MAKESSLKNMVSTLFIVCLVSSTLLGGVYAITKEPIEAAAIAKTNSSISQVVPAFDNDPSADVFTKEFDGNSYKIYPAKKGGEIVGYAVETFSTNGFGGRIVIMVGFNLDGTIFNTSVLSHSETPGLGDKMVEGKSTFSVQFKGKNPADFKMSVKKDGGDVDAITASTITSRAFCGALESAYEVYKLCVQIQTNKENGNE